MRVGHRKFPDEAGLENFSPHFLHIVGLDFQPDRSCSAQELAFIMDISIEKRDMEVVSQTKEIPVLFFFRDFAAEYITIKSANAFPTLLRN